MAQRRRSSRCSRGQNYQTKLRTFEALIAYNPLMIQEQVQRLFRDVVQRMLVDFAKAMKDHDMTTEMAAFRMEEHLESAVEEMEEELDRFGCWIENSFINKECIQRAKADLQATKKKRREKMRAVLDLTLKLSESLRNARIDELIRVLEMEVDRFRLREVKNTYEYDKSRSLRDKIHKEYDDHLERIQEKYEKTCSPLDKKYTRI